MRVRSRRARRACVARRRVRRRRRRRRRRRATPQAIVPADALAFVAVDTDFSSSQLKSAQAILDKFPIKAQAAADDPRVARRRGVGHRRAQVVGRPRARRRRAAA